MACPAIRPHFFGACPKKRCRAAKEKRFLPWRLHHSRERCCLGCLYSSSPDLRRGLVGVGALPFAGGERYSLRLLCAVGRLSGRHCTFTLPPTTQARFFGAPPRFFAQKQRNGVERAVGATTHRPRKRRTRSGTKKEPFRALFYSIPIFFLNATGPNIGAYTASMTAFRSARWGALPWCMSRVSRPPMV